MTTEVCAMFVELNKMVHIKKLGGFDNQNNS